MTPIVTRASLAKELRDYVMITIAMLSYAIGWGIFLLPNNITTGGVAGVSSLLFWATGAPVQLSYSVINGVLLLVALHVLGWRFCVKTVYAVTVLTVSIGVVTAHYDAHLLSDQPFMAAIIGSVFCGCGVGLGLANNGSTGGTDIIAASVNKFRNVSLGMVLTFVDFIIIGSCLFVPQFGDTLDRIHKIVFGFCTMVVENFMLDYVMNRRRQSVQFFIFSAKWQEIANALGTKTDHGVTILDGHGWYTGHERKVICLLARKSESTYIFRLIKMLDPNAFVSQSAVIGVYGEGFDEMKVKVKGSNKTLKKIINGKGLTT